MIQPLYDLVFVRRIEVPQKLIHMVNDKEPSGKGEVVAVGTGRILEDGSTLPLTLKVGEEVIFEKHAGVAVDHSGYEGDIIVIREDDILGVERD